MFTVITKLFIFMDDRMEKHDSNLHSDVGNNKNTFYLCFIKPK